MKTTPESKKPTAKGWSTLHKHPKKDNGFGHGLRQGLITSQKRIYPKLEVGGAKDPAEREADLAAEQVMRGGKATTSSLGTPEQSGALRMKANSGATGGLEAPAAVESGIQSKQGKGGSLPRSIQQKLSHTFGTDFSGVKVHTDSTSHDMNAQLRAKAFTRGSDMFFGKGQYAPGTPDGDRLIAHEAAHVVQGDTSTLRRKGDGREPEKKKKERLKGPKGVVADPETATISGTIYVEFDNDIDLGDNPDVMMNDIATQIAESINSRLSANTYRGNDITSDIRVIPVPRDYLPPRGAHSFKYGKGENDTQVKEKDKENNEEISWANPTQKIGYLYGTDEAGHEFLHWMGLSDRYTEVAYYSGDYNTRTQQTPIVDDARSTIPLANVQPKNEDDYLPSDNVMADHHDYTLTEYQTDLVFRGKNEREYDRDVVVIKTPEEQERLATRDAEAVEFRGHRARWFTGDNERLPVNQLNSTPATVYRFFGLFTGQNYKKRVRHVVYWHGKYFHKDSYRGQTAENRRLIKEKMRRNR